jgi:hypothetical protein
MLNQDSDKNRLPRDSHSHQARSDHFTGKRQGITPGPVMKAQVRSLWRLVWRKTCRLAQTGSPLRPRFDKYLKGLQPHFALKSSTSGKLSGHQHGLSRKPISLVWLRQLRSTPPRSPRPAHDFQTGDSPTKRGPDTDTREVKPFDRHVGSPPKEENPLSPRSKNFPRVDSSKRGPDRIHQIRQNEIDQPVGPRANRHLIPPPPTAPVKSLLRLPDKEQGPVPSARPGQQPAPVRPPINIEHHERPAAEPSQKEVLVPPQRERGSPPSSSPQSIEPGIQSIEGTSAAERRLAENQAPGQHVPSPVPLEKDVASSIDRRPLPPTEHATKIAASFRKALHLFAEKVQGVVKARTARTSHVSGAPANAMRTPSGNDQLNVLEGPSQTLPSEISSPLPASQTSDDSSVRSDGLPSSTAPQIGQPSEAQTDRHTDELALIGDSNARDQLESLPGRPGIPELGTNGINRPARLGAEISPSPGGTAIRPEQSAPKIENVHTTDNLFPSIAKQATRRTLTSGPENLSRTRFAGTKITGLSKKQNIFLGRHPDNPGDQISAQSQVPENESDLGLADYEKTPGRPRRDQKISLAEAQRLHSDDLQTTTAGPEQVMRAVRSEVLSTGEGLLFLAKPAGGPEPGPLGTVPFEPESDSSGSGQFEPIHGLENAGSQTQRTGPQTAAGYRHESLEGEDSEVSEKDFTLRRAPQIAAESQTIPGEERVASLPEQELRTARAGRGLNSHSVLGLQLAPAMAERTAESNSHPSPAESKAPGAEAEGPDLEAIARDVYHILKRRLIAERERSLGIR